MTEQNGFIQRMTANERHQQTLANNALLQAKNTRLEKEIKELKDSLLSLTLWQFIKAKYFKKLKSF